MQFNKEQIRQYLGDFKAYMEYKDIHWDISKGLRGNSFFTDKRQEGYKDDVYINAQDSLDFRSWTVENIGCGEIIKKAKSAINKAQNLVFANQKTHFKNKNDENTSKAEELLYNIYCLDDDEKSFREAVEFWGGKYDLIAYLFYIKDKEKYLPISPSNFDKKFAKLGIDLRMSYNCSYQNYLAFVGCMNELRKCMEEYFGFCISLLDAHSVIWMIDSVDEFITTREEIKADEVLTMAINDRFLDDGFEPTQYGNASKEPSPAICSGGRTVYPRDKKMALSALYLANHCCENDISHESFIRKNSSLKYMEAHHLVPMSQAKFFPNLDIPENIICLCCNCHKEIHYGQNAEKMIRRFYDQRKEYLTNAGITLEIEDLLKMY